MTGVGCGWAGDRCGGEGRGRGIGGGLGGGGEDA